MRLAAAQLLVRRRQHSAYLRAALEAVRTAGQLDPAPDVVVLPAALDLLDAGPTRHDPRETIWGATVGSFSAAAREWGFFVAVGLAAWHEGRAVPVSVLLDPDGDPLIVQPQLSSADSDGAHRPPGEALITRETLLGKVALLMRDDLVDDAAWDQARGAGVNLVLGCGGWPHVSGAGRPTEIAARAKLNRAWVAVADVVIRDEHPTGAASAACIISDGGRIAARPPADVSHLCVAAASPAHA